MSSAARHAGIWLLGGAIVRDPETGLRHNTAMLFDAGGGVAGSYRKIHLPEEEGFWETSHYVPGDEPPAPMPLPAVPIGVQICSDINRPQGTQLLAAQGAGVLLVPRATPAETYERWRLVLRANAVMAGMFVVSINRPAGEPQTMVDAESLAIAPDGSVLLETVEPLEIVSLDLGLLEEAGRSYPAYLALPSGLYARGWSAAPERPIRGPAESG